jgi:hypothetical protein
MLNDVEVEDRIRFVLAEAFEARVQEVTRRLPHLCRHNHRHFADTRKRHLGEPNEGYNRLTVAPREAVEQSLGLCMLGSESHADWKGDICEDPIDAQRCPYFEPVLDKTAIWQDFQDMLQDAGRLRAELPEVYGLLWALGGSTSQLVMPWWKRLWYRLLRVRVEPLQVEQIDSVKLLPPKS